MVSSFPKMQKSSASFSQSIRNRLRLKNLQAQAKNFCRVLDIRVPQIMEADLLQLILLQQRLKVIRHEVRIVQPTERVAADVFFVFRPVCRAHDAAVLLLLFAVADQRIADDRQERKCAVGGFCFQSVLTHGTVLAVMNGVIDRDRPRGEVDRRPA